MKTSVIFVVVSALVAFVVLLNLVLAASISFGLGLCGLVSSDYAAKRRAIPVNPGGGGGSTGMDRRTEPLRLAV